VPAISFGPDLDAEYNLGYGRERPWGQYTPAIVEPPGDSDLVEEWSFFYELARRMKLQLRLASRTLTTIDPPIRVDMARDYTTDDILEVLTDGSRVPLSTVKNYPRGAEFAGEPVVVAPKDPDWTSRLDVGNQAILADLPRLGSHADTAADADPRFDLRLVCRRATHVLNSSYNVSATNRGRAFNPAFMHPEDLAARGLVDGDFVEVDSRRAAIVAVAKADKTLRPGVVSMTHSYGGTDVSPDAYLEVGACTGRLLSDDEIWDPFSGQPLMTNVPVRVRRLVSVPGRDELVYTAIV
jgi:anaerobic selenocysteine-containing dehydrogenase